jgi:hypothetical protein
LPSSAKPGKTQGETATTTLQQCDFFSPFFSSLLLTD